MIHVIDGHFINNLSCIDSNQKPIHVPKATAAGRTDWQNLTPAKIYAKI